MSEIEKTDSREPSRLRAWMRRWRPRVTGAHILSYPLPIVPDFDAPLPEGVWMKKVVEVDDEHFVATEAPWRLKQAKRDFAQGEYCLLVMHEDRPIGRLWVGKRDRGANPFRGPRIRLAGDEEYCYGLWVDPEYRKTGVGIAIAFEYGELSNSEALSWLHVFVEEGNIASLRLLSKYVPMWESQTVNLLKVGPAFCVKIPGSARPKLGPFSRKGRHSGDSNRVPGGPDSGTDHLHDAPSREGRPTSAGASQRKDAGPDWYGYKDEVGGDVAQERSTPQRDDARAVGN